VLSKCYSYFVHLIFRPFRNIQRATRISVCVTAVSKSHEFLLKVHWLSYFFDNIYIYDAYAFASTRHNFFPRRQRDSTSTTSRCFFNDVRHYGVPNCGGDVISIFPLDSHLSWTIVSALFEQCDGLWGVFTVKKDTTLHNVSTYRDMPMCKYSHIRTYLCAMCHLISLCFMTTVMYPCKYLDSVMFLYTSLHAKRHV